jgi:hypothetical protein
MSTQKYRADTARINNDGSISHYAEWLGGPTLAKISQCQCEDGTRRTVYVTGEHDSAFSQPACVSVKSRRVIGFISYRDGNPVFSARDKRKYINRDYALMVHMVREKNELIQLFPQSYRFYNDNVIHMRTLAFSGFDYGEYPEY